MKFYLSSYKIGDETDKLKAMISANNKRTAYISNALDFSNDLERRKQREQADIGQLNGVGLSDIEKIDLRDYFGKKAKLEKKISEFGVIWVCGGNCFVLRQAMKLSGFDEILKGLLKKEGVLYGGYSAGVCVLAPTLKGMELVDDPNVKPYYKKILVEISKLYNEKLGDNLISIYIRGSVSVGKAKVVDNHSVEYNGKITSLSNSAQKILGYDYGVAGTDYWMYEEETLDERRKRLAAQE